MRILGAASLFVWQSRPLHQLTTYPRTHPLKSSTEDLHKFLERESHAGRVQKGNFNLALSVLQPVLLPSTAGGTWPLTAKATTWQCPTWSVHDVNVQQHDPSKRHGLGWGDGKQIEIKKQKQLKNLLPCYRSNWRVSHTLLCSHLWRHLQNGYQQKNGTWQNNASLCP